MAVQKRRVAMALGALLLIVPAVVGRAQQAAPRPALVDPTHRRMQADAAEGALANQVQVNVFGDPSKPGLYAIRRRFKPGEMSKPHYHDQDRLVTVIKGTWYSGEGDAFKPDATTPVRPGGFMLHPAGLHHFDGAKDEEVIVQIIGMGPVKTVDVDEKGRPTGTR
jgi:quercetin dioxygenase-like cupin family protein